MMSLELKIVKMMINHQIWQLWVQYTEISFKISTDIDPNALLKLINCKLKKKLELECLYTHNTIHVLNTKLLALYHDAST